MEELLRLDRLINTFGLIVAFSLPVFRPLVELQGE